jgi:thiamine-phosphate pyrophosphorylase
MANPVIEAARRLSRRRRGCRVPALLALTDPRIADPVAVAARLPRGAAVVLRHYDAPDRMALAWALASVARQRGLLLLIAGDWRLAARVKADGLHLPEGMARRGLLGPALGWRRRCQAVLTVAAHGAAGQARGVRLGADAALMSPVFPTRSHPGAPTLGVVRLAAAVWRPPASARVAVVALGGVDGSTVRRLAGTGIAGVAAVTALG